VNPKTKLVALGAAAISTAALMMVAAPAQAANKTYTLAAVKAHKSASNCWSAVNGKVYNLTKWVKKHPGGACAARTPPRRSRASTGSPASP